MSKIRLTEFWINGIGDTAFDVISIHRFPVARLYGRHCPTRTLRHWEKKSYGSPLIKPKELWCTRLRCELPEQKVWRVYDYYMRHGFFLLTLKAFFSK